MSVTDTSSPTTQPSARPEVPSEFLVGSAPHLAYGRSARSVMFDVVLAMVPLSLWMIGTLGKTRAAGSTHYLNVMSAGGETIAALWKFIVLTLDTIIAPVGTTPGMIAQTTQGRGQMVVVEVPVGTKREGYH